jgi:hypothetical protein
MLMLGVYSLHCRYERNNLISELCDSVLEGGCAVSCHIGVQIVIPDCRQPESVRLMNECLEIISQVGSSTLYGRARSA